MTDMISVWPDQKKEYFEGHLDILQSYLCDCEEKKERDWFHDIIIQLFRDHINDILISYCFMITPIKGR